MSGTSAGTMRIAIQKRVEPAPAPVSSRAGEAPAVAGLAARRLPAHDIASVPIAGVSNETPIRTAAPRGATGACVQRVIRLGGGPFEGDYATKGGQDTVKLVRALDLAQGETLRRGWKNAVRIWAGSKQQYPFNNLTHLLRSLENKYEKIEVSKTKTRPNFPSSAAKLGAMVYASQAGGKWKDVKPAAQNLALPHRFPYAAIQSSTQAFITGKETATDLERWSDRLLLATKERLQLSLPKLAGDDKSYYKKTIEAQMTGFIKARSELKKAVEQGIKLNLSSQSVQTFLKFTNALHGNIPDYGPHAGVNIQVSDRLHLHFNEDGTLTPGSSAAGSMTPTRVPKGIAHTSDDEYLVTTDGQKVSRNELRQLLRQQLSKFAVGKTSIDPKGLKKKIFK
ncbi:MAG TPA: hypothetical protein VII56_05355 [Rhizomicrobium sp.]